jgi:hypothetical protein
MSKEMAPPRGAIFLGGEMRIILGLCAALVLTIGPAAAQFGGGIGGGDSGAVRVPSMRDSDPYRHYWIPDGALGPPLHKQTCRTVIVRQRLSDGSVTARRTRRCV